MWTFLCALCVLWVTPILCTFDGVCPRKEPPPGVVVVSLGSELVLTCGDHVFVDGVKVVSNPSRSFAAAVPHSTHNAVLQKQHITMNSEGDGSVIPTSSSTSVSTSHRTKSDWDSGRTDVYEDEFDDEEKGERKFTILWKFNNKDMQGNTEGSTLSLSRVRKSDSGRYSCHHGGAERFSTRVIVAEAPETPHLSCYKKSPSSKIRCEWTPLAPVHKGTSCSLLIRKGLKGWFHGVSCSYSTRRSRFWCALNHDEDEKRTLHQAILCVSSFINNTTSDLLSFKPMQIIKPDHPYNVSVQPLPGLNRALMVTWRPPHTWKSKDRFYELDYEIRYKPLPSISCQTVSISDHATRHTITDAKEGQDYEVQVRAKSEYEGQWSDWSPPQYGRSWTDVSEEDPSMTPFPFSYSEGSGTEDPTEDYSVSMAPPQVRSHHYLWIMITIAIGLCLTILVVYIIRYKDKCMSKLQSLGVFAQCSDSVHPHPTPADIAPTEAERHALLNKACAPNEVKERSEQELRSGERIEEADINNKSYFLVQRDI
uniref:Fibronectin type-III domain-containing protein n=1 Tax=Neogobius melanostomus TaxID=47308 RepID=A0A8C6U0V2_9GOBI